MWIFNLWLYLCFAASATNPQMLEMYLGMKAAGATCYVWAAWDGAPAKPTSPMPDCFYTEGQ